MRRAVVGMLRLVVVGVILTFSAAWAADAGRFVKLDGAGQPLAATAAEWALVLDNKTGLIWETKTADGGGRDKHHLYSWGEAEDEHVAMLNRERFGGFSDWRMPTQEEIFTIREKKQVPNVDPDFFPHTVPSRYWSYYICGDGSFITKKIKFGTESTGGGKAYARAVRGGPED